MQAKFAAMCKHEMKPHAGRQAAATSGMCCPLALLMLPLMFGVDGARMSGAAKPVVIEPEFMALPRPQASHNGWRWHYHIRKHLETNTIAACRAPVIDLVHTFNVGKVPTMFIGHNSHS